MLDHLHYVSRDQWPVFHRKWTEPYKDDIMGFYTVLTHGLLFMLTDIMVTIFNNNYSLSLFWDTARIRGKRFFFFVSKLKYYLMGLFNLYVFKFYKAINSQTIFKTVVFVSTTRIKFCFWRNAHKIIVSCDELSYFLWYWGQSKSKFLCVTVL